MRKPPLWRMRRSRYWPLDLHCRIAPRFRPRRYLDYAADEDGWHYYRVNMLMQFSILILHGSVPQSAFSLVGKAANFFATKFKL